MKRYRRAIFSILLAVAVAAAMIPAAALSASAAWGGGTAYPSMNTDGYYLIDSGEKLAWFSARVNSGYVTIKAKQTADLDMGSHPFTPIGTASQKFKGIYNGGGYTISNLKVTGDAEGQGLFGYISTTVTVVTLHDVDEYGNQLSTTYTEKTYTPAEVNNVTLTAASITGSKNVGGIVGVSEGGKVFGCSVAGTVTSTGSNAGGIVGYNYSGAMIINCQNNAAVSGTVRIAGIAGYCYGNAEIYGCCNTGAVTGSSYVGGAVGTNAGCFLHHSYNKGVITGTTNSTGGLVGYCTSGELFCMYSIGSVSCPGEYSGAVLGNMIYGTKIAKLYYDRSDTTATDSFATAAEHELMLDASFLTALNYSMEIYVGDYFHTNDGYPILRWQLIGWDGSVGEPETNSSGEYLITSGSELAWFAGLVNGTLSGVAQNRAAKAQVMRDILLNPGIFDDDSKVWTPIGTETSPFIGTFDGGEHRISGVYLPDKEANYSGLFGSVGSGGTVKNIFLESSLIRGKNYSGAIAGAVLENGLIENCFNYSTVQSQYYTGGIAGMSAGTIRTCGNVGSVVGEYYSGGITGANNGGSVTSCFNNGKVTGVSRTGGILGNNYGVIRSCYNNGIVEGGVSVGGLVAYQNSGAENGFTACYNIGFVKGTMQVGAVVGYMQNGTLTYCYYDTERSGAADNALGATGKTSAQMAEPTSISAFDGFSYEEWVDRGADQYFDYCPELKVFYNSNNALLKATSKESAAVVKRSFTVMAEVDGEMNSYYASVKLGVQHIGTHEGTLTLIRDASVVETTVVNGNVTITDNAQTRTLTRGLAFSGSFFSVNGMLTLVGTGTDTLCLNGGGLSVSGAAPVYVASTGRVTLEKGALITANRAPSYGGGVYVNGGSLTMKGGKISGNSASYGGGLYSAGGVLVLEGGTITSNTAQNGGGVYLQGAGAEVTVSGTAVTNNSATNNGGGMYNQDSPVDWTGGTLTGNTAAQQGGGAYNAGTLRLSGGSISGNTAAAGVGVYQAGTLETSGKVSLASSDDIYLPSGRIVTNTDRISTSGTVANITAENYAAGTRVLGGEFCAANYAKYVVNVPAGADELFINSTGYLVAKETHNVARVSMFGAYSVYYTSLKEAVEAIGNEAGMITMVDNDNIEETINVQGNIIVTIVGDESASRTLTRYRTCTGAMFHVAEGATLEFGATGTADNASLIVDGGSTLYGTYGTCIVENHGTVRVKDGATLQNASSSGDGAAIRNSGTLEIAGGLIQNCTSANGGAVWNEGTVGMTGGTIRNSSAVNGGAIYNAGSLAFNGGTITANTASQNGGGICSASGSADMDGGVLETVVTHIVDGKEEPVLDENGNPTIIETVISGTLSGNTARNGGGMYVSGGTGSITSGEITGNMSPNGGGIYLAGGSYTVKGGSIASNTSSAHGEAIYNAAELTLDSVQIDPDGDIYLVTGHTVVPMGTAPSAVLTPASYAIGTPMLSGSGTAALHGGFTVSNDRFFVNASGLLDTTTISVKESSHMKVGYTDGFITGIDVEHRTVSEILAQFDNDASSLSLRSRKGTALSDDDLICTGCVIVLQDGAGNTLDSKTFVVVGDVNGDGEINGVDASHVYYFLAGMLDKNSTANAADYRAADADNDGRVDGSDADLLRACGLYKATVAQP
ncbi:MAG: hypothetical protein IKW76_07365 [Clostridia bacterium]|nr:hypothetical protein [Clostridia bacterium]